PSLAVAHLQGAVALVPGADAAARAAVLDELAGAADAAGDHTAGIPALQELLQLAVSADVQVTTRLRLASFLSAGGGDLPEAERLVGEAVALAQTASPARLAAALNEFGWIRGEGGDLEGQVRFAGESLALGETGGDAGAQLRALGPLAHAHMLLGRLGEARAANDRAVAMARSAGDLAQLEWHLSVRSEVLATAGDIDAAIAVVAPLAGSGRATTDVVHSNLVRYLWLAGRWDESLASARRLLAEAPTQVPVRTAWALAVAGAVEAAAGGPEAARPLLALGDRSYGGRDFYSFSALHDWGAGMAAWVLDDGDTAVVRLERSASWLERMGAVGMLPFVLADLCAVAALSDANEAAVAAQAGVERLNDRSSPVVGAATLACAALLGSGTPLVSVGILSMTTNHSPSLVRPQVTGGAAGGVASGRDFAARSGRSSASSPAPWQHHTTPSSMSTMRAKRTSGLVPMALGASPESETRRVRSSGGCAR
ncbi:MAG: hypothetical protein M3072_06590, partial [Candidatus Dormibacteraeota bacterium]|nr:hypothetical protein [Candidatus Dormibacteraeota bacterium]